MSISYYASVGAEEVGGRDKYDRDCGTCGAPAPTPTPPPLVVPTPTVVEVLGVERLPVTGEMPLPTWRVSALVSLASFALIGAGSVLRRLEG